VAIIGLLLTLVVAIIALKHALQIVVLGGILAYVLYYPSSFLARRTPLSYGLSVVLVFVLYLALAVVALLIVVPPILVSLLDLAQQIGEAIQQANAYLLQVASDRGWFANLGGLAKALLAVEDIQSAINAFTSTISGLVGLAGNIGALIMKLLTLNLFALFALLELPKLYRTAMSGLSEAYRRELSILAGRMSVKWTRYFWAMILFGILVGTWNFLQLTVLGIPGAPAVGLITGLLALIPVVGPFINVFVIGGVALIQGSTTLALSPVALAVLAVVINLIFVAIVAELVLPKIWGSAVSLPTIVIIPGVVIGAALFGPLGALVSVPLLGFCADLVGYTVHKIRGGDPYPGEPEPVFFRGLIRPRGSHGTTEGAAA
jgi:predicted PurR-regulated permease PerM